MEKILNKYLTELSKYTLLPDKSNCHHRGSLLSHSIWTARKVDQYVTKSKSNPEWIINHLVLGLDYDDKMLAILCGLFHDIGKCDNNKDRFIKPNHPSYGFEKIYDITTKVINNRSIDSYKNSCFYQLDKLCKFLSNKNVEFYRRYMGMFAIISKYHQSLGDIMQTHGTDREKTIQRFLGALNEDYLMFEIGHITQKILHILFLVSLADVKGSWKVRRNQPSKTLLPLLYEKSYGNNRFDCNDENVDCNHICHGTPWDRYGYNNVEKLIEKIFFVNGNLQVKENNVTITKLDGRTNLYKGVDDKKNYKGSKWNKATWLARYIDVPKIYMKSWGYKHIIKYSVKKGTFINLLRMDNKDNIIFILNSLKNYYLKGGDMKKLISGINNFILAYVTDRQDISNFISNQRTFMFGLDTLIKDIKNNTVKITRKSIHNIDIEVSNNILCNLSEDAGIKIDGYIANVLDTSGGDKFHEEVMICKPYETIEYKGSLKGV